MTFLTKFAIREQLKNGGDWLATARSWMQSNIRKGDILCWSSGELVQVPFCKLEEFALTVAVSAVESDHNEREAELLKALKLAERLLTPSEDFIGKELSFIRAAINKEFGEF